MSYQQLLQQLKDLQMAKSLPPGGAGDDKNIAAAAAGAGAGAGEGGGAGTGEGEGEVDDDDELMGKSFQVQLADGTFVKAVDGGEMLKALSDKIDAMGKSHTESEQGALQVLGQTMDMLKSMHADMATMRTELARLGGGGRGRQSTVAVVERPGTGADVMNKSMQGAQGQQPSAMTSEEFMGKCMAALDAGKLTGLEVSTAETYLHKGLQVPPALVAKVLAATKA